MELTHEQSLSVLNTIFDLFDPVCDGERETMELTESIWDDVITDIEETADWTGYAEDEVNGSDIRMAIVRVLKNKLGAE